MHNICIFIGNHSTELFLVKAEAVLLNRLRVLVGIYASVEAQMSDLLLFQLIGIYASVEAQMSDLLLFQLVGIYASVGAQMVGAQMSDLLLFQLVLL